MNIGFLFDLLLCLLILTAAAGAIIGKSLLRGVSMFIVYGLLLALAWVRLGAVDVALAEAAIGTGLTGVLLLGAVARLDGRAPVSLRFRSMPAVLSILLFGMLCHAIFTLKDDAAEGLGPAVQAELARSGAENPVTAVLLDFRGYDTLLESIVLLIALIAVWSLSRDAAWSRAPGLRQHVRPDGVLATFGRLLLPFGLVVGIYLVWIGTVAPGGAFQGGTVLAALWLLAMMAALVRPPQTTRITLRWVLICGPLLFLAVGGRGLVDSAFLTYPPGAAKPLFLAIETGLTLSIAVTLALLVLGPPRRAP